MSSHADSGWTPGASTPGDWAPGPELLAAYADGEFEGRDELAPLRQKLETWLERNPHAQEELAQYRKLQQLWRATTPNEPSGTNWRAMQTHVRRLTYERRLRARQRMRRFWFTSVLGIAACVAVLIAWRVGPLGFNGWGNSGADAETFPVAGEHEVVILRVEGDDASSLVVGQLPASGPLDVIDGDDVNLRSVQPARKDAVPQLERRGPGAPALIWTRLESEK